MEYIYDHKNETATEFKQAFIISVYIWGIDVFLYLLFLLIIFYLQSNLIWTIQNWSKFGTGQMTVCSNVVMQNKI